MTDIKNIQQTLSVHKPMLQRDYHVKTIGIFGSYARGEQTPDSDIDVLVEFNKPVGLDFLTLQYKLQEILGSKVDLVTPAALKTRMRDKILQEVVYS